MTSSSKLKVPPTCKGAKIPWPIPERPVRLAVCESLFATYSVVVVVEAWDKNDPRAVAAFRCERHTRGQTFPACLLLQRLPIRGLTRRTAAQLLENLKAFLSNCCRLEVLSANAFSGRFRERVNKVRRLAFPDRSNGRANYRPRGDVGLEPVSGDVPAPGKSFSGAARTSDADSWRAFTVDIGRQGDEAIFVLVATGFGGPELSGFGVGDEVCRVVMPVARVQELLELKLGPSHEG